MRAKFLFPVGLMTLSGVIASNRVAQPPALLPPPAAQLPYEQIVERAPAMVEICWGKRVEQGDDGRLLNHFPFPSIAASDVRPPPVLAGGNCQGVNYDLSADFTALLKSARMDLGPDLYAISCLRNTTYQRNLFCGNRSRGIPPAQRAETVAPPGYSEHHTGYAVDFGSAHVPQCQFRYCFGRTRAGEWLKHHAPEFGFEMSFPPGNVQGVAPEPWHWRWVGHGADPSSQRAQQIFWKARTRFPTPYGELAQGLLKK